MKRFILVLLALCFVFALCACNKEDETIVQDGMKLAGREAGNQAVDFNFTYPEAWELIRNDGVVELQLDCDDSAATAQYATLTVLTFSLYDPNQSAKAYWAEYEKDVSALYKDYKLLDTEEYNEADKYLDDAPALKVKYQGALNGKSYVNEQLICCRYGKVYIITAVVPEEFSDKILGVMASVKANFNFVD